MTGRRWRIRVQWEPRDLWVGVYWKKEALPLGRYVPLHTFFVCLIPCLPIVIQVRGK